MSPEERNGLVALAAAVVFALSAVVGWHFLSARSEETVDSGGFDVAATRAVRPRLTGTAAPQPAAPASGLSMIAGGASALQTAEGAAPPPAAAPAATPPASAPEPARTLSQARLNFIAAARRHESEVVAYARKLTAQSPVIRKYGEDWMSYPDLKKLNDDYQRDHDPVAFALGLAKAPNFSVMLAKYAGAPDLQAAVVMGVTKEAPPDLVQAGWDLAKHDPQVKSLAALVARKLGLPPGMTAVLTSPDPSAGDKARAAAELKAARP